MNKGKGKAKILIVDDEELILIGWRYTLASEGYDVETSSRGAQAIEIARSQKPDLVITDLFMPDTDGIEVCREIKKLFSGTRVVLITGYPEDSEIMNCRKDFIAAGGSDQFLTKPLTQDDIISAVENILRMKK